MASLDLKTQTLLRSIADRRRVKERFRATLAGLMELEVLRCKHRRMVETVLGEGWHSLGDAPIPAKAIPGAESHRLLNRMGHLRLSHSLSQEAVGGSRSAGQPRVWFCRSTENLMAHGERDWGEQLVSGAEPKTNLLCADSRSRASSGFCDDDDGNFSLFGSQDSLASSVSHGVGGHRSSPLCRRSIPLQSEEPSLSLSAVGGVEVIPAVGLVSIADLCPTSHWRDVSGILQSQVILDAGYRADLVFSRSSEVYRYPSPLHAVALQSPLFSSSGASAFAEHSGDEGRSLDDAERCPGRSHLMSCTLPAHSSALRSKHRRLEEVILRVALGHQRLSAASKQMGGAPGRRLLPMQRSISVSTICHPCPVQSLSPTSDECCQDGPRAPLWGSMDPRDAASLADVRTSTITPSVRMGFSLNTAPRIGRRSRDFSQNRAPQRTSSSSTEDLRERWTDVADVFSSCSSTDSLWSQGRRQKAPLQQDCRKAKSTPYYSGQVFCSDFPSLGLRRSWV